MVELLQVQEFLDGLDGSYTIQKLQNGQVLFSLTTGSVSTTTIRPTFTEAASHCISHAKKTARHQFI